MSVSVYTGIKTTDESVMPVLPVPSDLTGMAGLPGSAAKYDFSLNGNLLPCTHGPGGMCLSDHEMPDEVKSHYFRLCSRIEARLTDSTSLSELADMVEESAIDPRFRLALFWGLMVEWAYRLDGDGMSVLSQESDMRYLIISSRWSCLAILPR